MTPRDILNLPLDQPNDAKAATVRDYLRALLSRCWEEEESFSGKRPFGNSGWQSDVNIALIKAGVVKGKLDSDGYIVSCDHRQARHAVSDAIAALL